MNKPWRLWVHALCWAVVCELMMGSVGWTAETDALSGLATVKRDGVPLHTKSATKSEVMGALPRGASVQVEFAIYNAAGHWCHVTEVTSPRRAGYVRCEDLDLSANELVREGHWRFVGEDALKKDQARLNDIEWKALNAEWKALNAETALLAEQGRYDRAAVVAKKALAVAEKADEPDSLTVVQSLNILALLYDRQGQYAQAEPLYKRSLAIWEKIAGPEDPIVAESLKSMAALFRKTDREKEAEALEKRAAAIPTIKQRSDGDRVLFEDLLKIARQGNPEAQYHVGMMFNNGLGVAKDSKKAFEWFDKSAKSGDPLGSYKLGCYFAGQFNVVPIDPNKALRYKLVAAQAGYVLAQIDVGGMYFEKHKFHEAIHWWELAAKQGAIDALYNLSNVYKAGKVVPKDNVRAFAYFKLAKLLSEGRINDKAQTDLDEIKKLMSRPDYETAEQIVSQWKLQPAPLTIKARMGLNEANKLVGKK